MRSLCKKLAKVASKAACFNPPRRPPEDSSSLTAELTYVMRMVDSLMLEAYKPAGPLQCMYVTASAGQGPAQTLKCTPAVD